MRIMFDNGSELVNGRWRRSKSMAWRSLIGRIIRQSGQRLADCETADDISFSAEESLETDFNLAVLIWRSLFCLDLA